MTNDWKTKLPQVYDWFNQVKVTGSTQTLEDKSGIVACAAEKKGETWQAVTNAGYKAEIDEKLKAANWQGSQAFQTEINGQTFMVVSETHFKVSSHQKARQWGLDIAAALLSRPAKKLFLDYPSLEALVGLTMGFHQSNNFKKTSPMILPEEVFVHAKDADAIAENMHLSKAIALTRFVQDAPANWLTPTRLADISYEVLTEAGLKVTIKNKSDLESLGMNLFLSVARGSVEEPKMVVIEKEGTKAKDKYFSIIGKGLTFDAGGISIKPSAGMDEMKYDMSGGAAILGAMFYLSRFDLPMSCLGVIGCTENMPSGHATKPGDVFTAYNKKTVEVLNTDAEGRLVLADVLSWVCDKYKPEYMMNAATLTGACLHALGHFGGAIISPNDKFSAEVMSAAIEAGEPMWPLPLWPETVDENKGSCGDLSNIAKPNVRAGTIMAGAFLRHFVDEDVQWAHLDIAGTAWQCKAMGYPKNSGSAFGMRTMAETCKRLNK